VPALAGYEVVHTCSKPQRCHFQTLDNLYAAGIRNDRLALARPAAVPCRPGLVIIIVAIILLGDPAPAVIVIVIAVTAAAQQKGQTQTYRSRYPHGIAPCKQFPVVGSENNGRYPPIPRSRYSGSLVRSPSVI
jgi:hypothetical protein